MSENPSQPRAMPARRRQGRNNGRAPKAYASENDAANMDSAHERGPPRTPQKTGLESPAPQGTQPGSKQRSRASKPRPSNVPMSPELGNTGHQTPPHISASFKSGAAPAFAGATFHASPAPSALPIPSFFARPATDSPSLKDSQDVVQEPSPPTDTDVPTPSHPSSMPTSRNQESPLDFMFRAHRQERERQRHASPANNASFRPVLPNNASPSSRSPLEPSSLPRTARSQARFQSGGIAFAELDGTPGRPMGPAFSTPYQDRIRAARTNSSRSANTPDQPQQVHQPHQAGPAPEDPTEALKKYLFSGGGNGAGQAGPRPISNGYTSDSPAQTQSYRPAPSHGMNGSPNGHSNDLRSMENDLRRILKLDLAPGPSGPERRLFPETKRYS
ncbi:hypothetical protein G7046_g5518 [Stylonectria norvegica]|nr:hypothetical protein G7046_g5518 [Stylonectria norvegica]